MSTKVKRLYADFKPEHYDLSLELYPDKMSFTGSVKIKGHKTGRPSSRLTFHQKDLKVNDARITFTDKKGDKKNIALKRLNLHKAYDEVRLHTEHQLYAGSYTIELKFSGNITKPMDGIYPCYFKENDKEKIILATQFESHHARQVFPCIDEPEAKATFKLAIETDKGLTTISNTDPISEKTENDRTLTKFSKTPKMSTYLLAFVSGDMKFKESRTSTGIRVRAYATPDNVGHTTFALDTAVRCLDFYHDYFGIEYPLDKCDIIALPDFASGAMENWGCITFREQCMLVDKRHTSVGTKQFVALVVAHELAHQWFGNLVTMRWWTDLWLNEGFASWIEYLACDNLFPDWKLWTQFLVDEREQALKLDALKSTHPIEVPVRHPDEIRTIFDAISYNKGASVINMLHGYLGPKAFRSGLNHYLSKHAYGNTDTVDLWEALEQVSKKPVKRFMHAWTSLPGFPVLQVSRAEHGDKLHQTHFLLSQSHAKEDHIWPIPLLSDVPKDPSLLERRERKLPRSRHPRVLNQGQIGFYRTSYDETSISQLVKLVHDRKLPVTDRLGLLSDAFETAKAGENSTVNALKLLESYEHEDSAPVWDVIAGSLASVRAVMDSEELRDLMKPYVISLATAQFERLSWDKKTDEPYFDQLLRPIILSLLAVSDDPHVIDHAKRLFKKMHEPDDIDGFDREIEIPANIKRGVDIDPDLRGVVYGTVVRHGGEEEFNKLLKMHNDSTNSEERNTIAAALTGFRQPELVKKALSLITTDSVRLQDAMYWLAYSFMNRFGRDEAWKWLKNHWSWLELNFSGDLGFYRVPVYAARAYSSEDFLEKFKEFFEPKRSPAFDRSIDQGAEILTWHIAWKNRDFEAVKKYFQETEFGDRN